MGRDLRVGIASGRMTAYSEIGVLVPVPQRDLVLCNGGVTTNRLAIGLSKCLPTREDLFPRSPFRGNVRIAQIQESGPSFVDWQGVSVR
jgi:hypothetical protein